MRIKEIDYWENMYRKNSIIQNKYQCNAVVKDCTWKTVPLHEIIFIFVDNFW